jgi:hypothetical protein
MILVLMLVGSAYAWPERVAATLELGSAIEDVVVSRDGQTVAVLSANTVHVVDSDTWTLMDAAPCESVGGIAASPIDDVRFYAACTDGSLSWFEVTDGAIKNSTDPVDFSDTDLIGLTSNSTLVFGLAEHPSADGNPQVVAYNPALGSILSNGYPTTLGYRSVDDLEANDQFLFLSHGGSSFSKVDTGSGGATQQQGAPGAAQTSDIITIGTNRVLVAGGRSGVLDFQTGSNVLSLFLNEGAGVESASALAANVDEEWFAISDTDQQAILIHDLEPTSGTPQLTQMDIFDLPTGGGDVREFGVVDGYLFAGTDNGELHIMTDRPWVEIIDGVAKSALNGDEVAIGFSSDTGGEWTALLGASDNESGERLAQGSVEAGDTSWAQFTVDGAFREGENTIRIVVEDGLGRVGHDSTTIQVDNPPSTVRLRDQDVDFGDGSLIVQLNGIDDEDLSHYKMYVSSTVIEAEEYPTEGPPFVGVETDDSGGTLDLPRRITASPSENRTITIQPLTNGVTYYVAIRAYDAAGQEGPMSTVISETPRETFGAADLAGDNGGFACSSSAAPAAGLMAMLAGLVAIGRRRSGLALLTLGLFASAPAQAEVDSEWPQAGKTFSDFVGKSFAIRYSQIELQDENLTQVFGDESHSSFWLEYGPTLFELVELTGGIGYYNQVGARVDASGAQSGEEDTMLAIPLTLNGTFRFDVLPEQLIVPFAGIGYDYWLWQESWKGGNKIQGGKKGTHTTVGAHLLLDIFQPGRAGRLQAGTGITDTFITIEWRKQLVGEDSGGLTFSGDAISVGLKLDH